jgi:hypothetical protein
MFVGRQFLGIDSDKHSSLPPNMLLVWKGLTVPNTLAYYEKYLTVTVQFNIFLLFVKRQW